MAKILAVGVATLDWIQVVQRYPVVDSELRAQSQYIWRGGNASNTLTVLSELGHHCSWLGTLADDCFADIICADLEKNNIEYSMSPKIKNSITPTSHILLSKETASRNIIHFRSLRELVFEDTTDTDFSQWDWVHFEGRNILETKRLMQKLKKQHPKIILSLEIEKPRQGIESLFGYADHCLFSRHYVNSNGYDSAEMFLRNTQEQLQGKQDLVCAWGDQGAMLLSSKGEYAEVPASNIDVKDTRAAGDVFNAAYIHAQYNKKSLLQSVEAACYLAGVKCAQLGIENLSGN